jgi:hypothetical protein
VPPDERLPLGDEDDYVPTQADMDPTTWTPPKAPPEGLTPAPNGRPGQYLDGARRTVWRTGDPRRDSFLERESGLVEGIISDHPQMRLSDSQREALGFTGETPEENAEAIQVIGNRPDPYMIDAKARRYAAAAMPEPLAQLDPRTGRPVPPSEDDLAYVQARNLDQGFSDRVESLARERATEEERAARALPLQEEHARSAMAVADQRRELLDRYVADHRRFWDEARGAQARADAMYPNPDDLLGGEGSWSRAMALGIASVNSPVAFQGLSAVINSQMALEWAGQQAAYGRERQREATALGNAEEAYRTMATEDGARVAQGAAAKERLAAGLELVGARTADQAVQAKYQGLAGQLRLEAAKDLGAMATQMANRDLKDAQLAMKGMHYDTKLHRWVSMFGDGGGGTGGPGGAPGQAVQSPTNPFGKLGVREPDRSGRPGGWWQSSDDDSAKKAREAGIEYGKLDDAINQMQVLAAQAKGAKSAGAQAWSKWQSEHEAEYKLAFLNATQLAARVLHGRPPGKFTMQEVHDEYPQLASAWESNNVEGVIRWLRDDADRNYNKSMHQYGYNGTYLSDRPTPTQAPTAEELRRSVVGDYVPGHAPDVEAAVGQNRGGSADDRGALGAYVKEYYTLLNGTDGGLASSLDEMRRKADGNRLRAVQRKDVAGASKWRVIAESIGSQAAEVRSGTARKAIEAQRAAEAERNRLGDSLMRLPH